MTEAVTSSDLLTIRASETAGLARRSEPVTIGVPLARGRVPRGAGIGLSRDDRAIPCQAQVLDQWADGSARWVLLDFLLDAQPRQELSLLVSVDASGAAPAPGIRSNRTERGWFVDTGSAQFTVERDAFLPFRSVRADGVELLDAPRCGWSAVDANGVSWTPQVDRLERETDGSLRTTLVAEGSLRDDGGRALLAFVARLHFFAGRRTARVALTVRNPRKAHHPGGHWELGDAGSVLVRDLGLRVAPREAGEVSWSAEPTAPLAAAGDGAFELYQDSSGGENWRSRVHLTRDHEVPTRFRGYRVRIGDSERLGLRATPRVAVHRGGSGVSFSMRHFWQNFPKAIDVRDGVLALWLFPRQFAALHEIQGGEQKTHDFWMSFGADAADGTLDGLRTPLVVHPSTGAFVQSGAIPYLTEAAVDGNAQYLELVSRAIEGDDTFARKRETADEYGWRHFGELWADHESKYSEIPGTFVSHYNNQYDVVFGAFLQFARTGDPRWRDVMEELARHVIDVDIYHTTEDKAAYNRGLFWHTVHYVDADLSTHRSYPRKGSAGGGPDDEHNYTTGLMHYHFLTGDPLGRETVIDSAQWVVDADDGAGTIFRWLDGSPTGLASKTRHFDYHGPGRGAGNSINALIDGWRLTGGDAFLAKCVELLHRSIHPRDDLEKRNLLDAENRWSYTVHLHVVGKFLDTMVERDRLDAEYAYARASLLSYARWMAEHERPILAAPDELEYPNETWAAQEIRKSDVFKFAALHALGEERERFVERGEWFFRESLRSLASFDTKGYVRPVAILMRYGLMQSWWDQHPHESRPAPRTEWSGSPPVPFVPQKIRAMRKAKRLAAAAGAIGLLGIVLLVRWLV